MATWSCQICFSKQRENQPTEASWIWVEEITEFKQQSPFSSTEFGHLFHSGHIPKAGQLGQHFLKSASKKSIESKNTCTVLSVILTVYLNVTELKLSAHFTYYIKIAVLQF